VEIGPGQGALTQRLLDAAGQLDVVEIDRDLAGAAARAMPISRASSARADALEIDWRALAARAARGCA
jgi:16S rRNA (adenine1518-N6/adenine1519-N6)-dimethyltransferase